MRDIVSLMAYNSLFGIMIELVYGYTGRLLVICVDLACYI